MAMSPSGSTNPWYYEMNEPGYNYRLTDIQAALGLSQLGRLDSSLTRRNELAGLYTSLIAKRFDRKMVTPLDMVDDSYHAYHLFVTQIDFVLCGVDRAEVMTRLRAAGIGTQVHYIPVCLQPYYQGRYGFTTDDYPGAMSYYNKALSLPMYPGLTNDDVEYVVDTLATIIDN
jgi:dTDP-4-amino-4,6-dideoxygalactose transaminase